MMDLSSKVLYRSGFALFLIIFIIFKLPVLNIPYFWDELGVYVPGMRAIADNHRPGILPADLDPEFSRGHPLLFYFIGATAFKLFGDSVLTGHLMAIIIAVLTLVAFYKMCESLFNEKVALIAAILLAMQPVFFAMSGVVLPEMLLTLFVVLSVWGIVACRWYLFALAASLAMMTKEAAIILPLLASLILFIDALRAGDLLTLRRWKLFMLSALPLLVFGIFLMIQKSQNGWYFFPEHMKLIHFSFHDIYYFLKIILFQLFIDQGRWFLLLFPAAAMMFFSRSFFALQNRRPLLVFSLLIVISALFSSVNYFLARYHLYVYPFFILICVSGMEHIFSNLKFTKLRFLYVPVTAIALLLSFLHMNKHKFNDTYDMGYTTAIICVKDFMNWLEKQPVKHSSIKANFPIEQAMEDKRNGYTREQHDLVKGWDTPANYLYAFYLDGQITDNPLHFDSLITRFDRGYAHIEVFTFKK